MPYPIDNSPPAYHYNLGAHQEDKSGTEKYKHEIQRKVHELYDHSDLSSSYQLSIPLLLSAQIQEKALYSEVAKKIYKTLGLSNHLSSDEFQILLSTWGEKATFNLWIMGRILIAAETMNEAPTAKYLSKLLLEGLNAPFIEVDPFSTWSFGYLAVYHSSDPKEYPYFRDKMMTSTDILKTKVGEKEKDNVQWAMVMDLLAAGKANDASTYSGLLQELKDWTNKHSVSEAILTIPREDFTAWALSIVKVAASKIGDADTYDELDHAVEEAILVSPSEQDKLLAEVNNLLL